MSLAAWLAKNAPHLEHLGKRAGDFARANRTPLAAAAAAGGTLGAYELGKPMVDDFLTDQALHSMGRNVKRAAADTMDFADEHPYTMAALVGGSGLAGAALGEDGFRDVYNAVSPLQAPQRRGRR